MDILKQWAFHLVENYGMWGLFTVAFMESSFFPIPPDVILIGMIFTPQAPHTAWIATVCTAGSVLGAVLGWWIGAYGGHPLLHRWFGEEKAQRVEQLYQRYGVYAVLVAAFTPIPYKVFTIASGVFRFNIWSMLGASVIGRGARFFLVAYLTEWLGKEALKRMDIVMLALLAIGTLLVAASLYWRYRRKIYTQSAEPHA
jgi:undecaprenyl-diphosphatase